MASAKLIVKSNQKGNYATVYLRLYQGREIDLIVPTEFRIYPEIWNNKSQSFKRIYSESFTQEDRVELEDEFFDLRTTVLKELNARNGRPINKEWLQGVVYKFHHKTEKGAVTLNQYISQFISDIETGKRLYDHNNRVERYKPLTIKNYRGFKVQFDLYQQEKRKQLDFEHINIDFYDEFVRWFILKGYSPNTIGRHVKHLKVLMRIARNEGLHHNDEFTRRKFKSMKAEVQNIYLTERELKALYDLDLSDKPHFQLVRDVFLVGCYTAQRYGDYSRIRAEMIRKLENGRKVIDLIQQKTGERVIVPIRPELETILKRYDYTLPKTYEQKVNRRIKDIADEAGINESVLVEELKGGLKVSKQVPKNELIKTHTARRTGCTLMYLSGIPSIDVMKISGHRSEREFLGYIKTTKEEVAASLSMHPYFNHLKAE